MEYHMQVSHGFKNTSEPVNLGALKYSLLSKLHIFQCICKIFCGNFLTTHLTHTLKVQSLYNVENLTALRFMSLYAFFKCPPGPDITVPVSGCWCPGNARIQGISILGIGYLGELGSCLLQGRFSATLAISLWRSDRIWKPSSIFPEEKNCLWRPYLPALGNM